MSSPNDQIIRKSFGLKKEILPQLQASYHSSLITKIKEENYQLSQGRLTVKLAREFGFCYGVDRAIDYAYETRAKFPARRIFLTNEIIHNPRVNAKLQEMGVEFLSGPYTRQKISIQDIQKDDVVIIPAFGTTTQELTELGKRGCVLVDTTCGSVMSVWNRVESYAREGFTSIIHGKYDHEETKATSSRAMQYAQGKYLVVRDKKQAALVCDYIEGRGERGAFLAEFAKSFSQGFDPDRDLGNVGCANQTTMLSSESLEIASMLQESIRKRFGEAELPKRFRHFDTICSATQERQDAVVALVREGLDLMLVVGGYNSSNTGHLAEISSEYGPAYHIKDASCLVSKEWIQHKKIFSDQMIETQNWLPDGKRVIGVTAGASTPNRVVEEVIEKILTWA